MVQTTLKKNKIKSGVLKNGIKYILNDNDTFSSCCIIFYIRVGAMHENPKELGISHVLEHMLFKGTQRFQTFMDLNKNFDILNCNVNAATSKHLTYIDMKLPYQNLNKGLELLEEMVFKSLFLEEELKKEMKVIIEEFNRVDDNPSTKLEILTTQFNFQKHRLSNLILGSRENVMGFSRKDIMRFYKKYYIPSNCTISIVGNLKNSIVKDLNKIFSMKDNKMTIKHEIVKYENPNADNFLYKKNLGKQNTISISFPIFSIMDIRKYYLDILIDILGGNMTSRLWVALREENQLVYIFNVFYESYEDGGFFSINFTTSDNKVNKTIHIIMEILEKMKKIKISEDELKLTQKKAIMDIEINSEESCEIAEFYGEQVILEQEVKTYKDISAIYKKCNLDILQKMCQEIFVFEKMKIVILGNIEKQKFNKITKNLLNKKK
jgi:predicted Zn-dependent peptidase